MYLWRNLTKHHVIKFTWRFNWYITKRMEKFEIQRDSSALFVLECTEWTGLCKTMKRFVLGNFANK